MNHILHKLCVAFKKYSFLVAKIKESNLHLEEKNNFIRFSMHKLSLRFDPIRQ